MSPYFESIRIQHRQIHLLPYHAARLNRTRRDIFGLKDPINLDIQIPDYLDNDIWKCRVTYGTAIENITFEPYQARNIQSIKLIQGQADIEYTYKGDRAELQKLYDQRGDADDIIIVRDDYLTDSFWSNITLSQGGRWYTPATPLLKGTMRQYLLDQGQIAERIIRASDIHDYDQIMPINALNPFDITKAISTQKIINN